MYDGVTLAKILTFTLTNPHNILFRAHDQYFHRNDHLVKVNHCWIFRHSCSLPTQVLVFLVLG